MSEQEMRARIGYLETRLRQVKEQRDQAVRERDRSRDLLDDWMIKWREST